MKNLDNTLEELVEQVAYYVKCVNEAKTMAWRCRMEANLWLARRYVRCKELGITYAELPYDDNGAKQP